MRAAGMEKLLPSQTTADRPPDQAAAGTPEWAALCCPSTRQHAPRRGCSAVPDHLSTCLWAIAATPAWAAEDDCEAVAESAADLEWQAAHICEATHGAGVWPVTG